MSSIDVRILYKQDTGETALDEVQKTFTCWRSQGKWVIDITDAERLQLWGRQSDIEIIEPDYDYVQWLEDKVTELMKKLDETKIIR